jgi:dTDP-4-amino-4,6-dideoxygalactose transaminase
MRQDHATLRAAAQPVLARVPFNDLTIQWREIADEVRCDFEEVFARSAFSSGPFVKKFESEIAAYLDTKHAIAVNSGTSALHLALAAADIGAGDEVLVPAHTFIATLWGPLYVGARPILCDVDDQTGTIDLTDAESRITPHTKAIIPVHLYGQPADMEAVMALAARHGLLVVEDAAQAIGARWNGRQVGTVGRLGCYSFYPGKNLGAAGEGGLVTTDDDALAKRVRSLHDHGQSERYTHDEIGFNYRMDGLQAVVLRHKLRHIDRWTARRKEIAARYQMALSGLPVEVPRIHHQDHVWHLFVIRTPERDALREHLRRADIDTGLHYPIPNHRQPCLRHLPMDRESYPRADRWARAGLSLPLYYGMGDADVDRVTEAVAAFFRT